MINELRESEIEFKQSSLCNRMQQDIPVSYIITSDFEIIQNEPDEIKELDDGYDLKGLEVMGYDVSKADYKIINEVYKNGNKINELIRKVNEINRKLEEK